MQKSPADTLPQLHPTDPATGGALATVPGPPHRAARESYAQMMALAYTQDQPPLGDIGLDPTMLGEGGRSLTEGLLEQDQDERYELLQVLGNGGMGVVYKARDLTLGRVVAIKTLRPSLQLHQQALRLMTHEAQVLAQIRHPNLPTIFDVLQHGRQITLVMEYVRGEPLDIILARSPRGLEVRDAVQIWLQLLAALSYLHNNQLLHRDIKPGNLMLERDGTLRLMDFGLAWELQAAQAGAASRHGTPAYMAPEQLRGEALSSATDLYAAALTLYESLEGHLPFPDTNLAHHHLNTEPGPLSRDDVPPALARQLQLCLRKDQRQRPGDAERLLRSLISELGMRPQELPLSAQAIVATGPATHPGHLVRRHHTLDHNPPPETPPLAQRTHLTPPPMRLGTQEARALSTSAPTGQPGAQDPPQAGAQEARSWIRSLPPGMQRFLVLTAALLICVFTLAMGVLASYVLGPLPTQRPPVQATLPPPP